MQKRWIAEDGKGNKTLGAGDLLVGIPTQPARQHRRLAAIGAPRPRNPTHNCSNSVTGCPHLLGSASSLRNRRSMLSRSGSLNCSWVPGPSFRANCGGGRGTQKACWKPHSSCVDTVILRLQVGAEWALRATCRDGQGTQAALERRSGSAGTRCFAAQRPGPSCLRLACTCTGQHMTPRDPHPKALASTTTRSTSSCTMSFTHTVKMPAQHGMGQRAGFASSSQ